MYVLDGDYSKSATLNEYASRYKLRVGVRVGNEAQRSIIDQANETSSNHDGAKGYQNSGVVEKEVECHAIQGCFNPITNLQIDELSLVAKF